MSIIRWIIVGGLLLAASQGNAQLLLGIAQSNSGGGTPIGCSNSLDFTKACNSQYIGTLS